MVGHEAGNDVLDFTTTKRVTDINDVIQIHIVYIGNVYESAFVEKFRRFTRR